MISPQRSEAARRAAPDEAGPLRPGHRRQRAGSLLELIRAARLIDWFFAGLSFALLWYAAYNVVAFSRDPGYNIDVMLLTGGLTFLIAGWWVSRIGDRVARMLEDLDAIGAVIFDTSSDLEAARRELDGIGRRYGLYGGLGLALVQAAVIGGAIATNAVPWRPGLALAGFCIACSVYAGFRFGQFYANGQLFRVLLGRGYNLRAGGDLLARAIVPLRELFGAGTVAGMVLCGYFAFWSVVWLFGLGWAEQFRQWHQIYVLPGLLSVVVLLFIGIVPVRRFMQRIDAIYGSADERAAMVERQLALTRHDLSRIAERVAALRADGKPRQAERLAPLLARQAELEDYTVGLQSRTTSDWLMRPVTIYAVAGAATFMILLSAWRGGVRPPGL